MFSKKDEVNLTGTASIGAAPMAVGQGAAKPTEQQRVTYRYVDRPDCAETFADSIVGVFLTDNHYGSSSAYLVWMTGSLTLL